MTTLHITRHGQTDVASDHPPGDPRLTGLGREQARRLGERLAGTGFNGPIYSSPYLRTMETARCVADVTGSEIVPVAEMREYVIREDQMDRFGGATMATLQKEFSSTGDRRPLPQPWWTTAIESDADIEDRVRPLLDEVVAAGDDALLVGHGASVAGTHRVILGRHDPERIPEDQVGWNCMLTSFRMAPTFETIALMDVGHLTEHQVTNNARTRAEVLAERISCD